MKETIRQKILSIKETKHKNFSAKLLPGVENILGVKLPILRNIAKEITQDDWQTFININDEDLYFEEVMLQDMVISSLKIDIETKLILVKDFIPKINNWSVCDSFCAGFKMKVKEKKIVWDFLLPYLSSSKEFEVRFAVVMLLDHYVDNEHIKQVIFLLDNVKNEGYYAKMAVAWAISLCFIKFPEITMPYLQKNNLDDFSHNTALQKILDSLRVNQEDKIVIRKMKRLTKT